MRAWRLLTRRAALSCRGHKCSPVARWWKGQYPPPVGAGDPAADEAAGWPDPPPLGPHAANSTAIRTMSAR